MTTTHNGLRRSALAATVIAGCAALITSASAQHSNDPVALATGAESAAPNHQLPKIEARAPRGFRLYRPGYRLSGNGALVAVQLCRLPGWAAPSPSRLRIERIDAQGSLGESRDLALNRLGMRVGNNCTSVGLRLDSAPNYGETLKICALARGGKCP